MRRPIAKALLVLQLAARAARAAPRRARERQRRDPRLQRGRRRSNGTTRRASCGALDQLPSDLDEYTDCRTVIRSAQLAGRRQGKGSARGRRQRSVDTARAAEPGEEQRSIDERGSRRRPVHIGGQRVKPGATRRAVRGGRSRHRPSDARAGGADRARRAMAVGAAFAVQRRWPAHGGRGPRWTGSARECGVESHASAASTHASPRRRARRASREAVAPRCCTELDLRDQRSARGALVARSRSSATAASSSAPRRSSRSR